jgi:hypothetical protein
MQYRAIGIKPFVTFTKTNLLVDPLSRKWVQTLYKKETITIRIKVTEVNCVTSQSIAVKH